MKNIKWKNVTITILAVAVITLIVQNTIVHKSNDNLTVLVDSLISETEFYENKYQETLNELYFLEVETGIYDEYN